MRFFNAKKKRFETIRGDVGGHYPKSAAKSAMFQRFHAARDIGPSTPKFKEPIISTRAAGRFLMVKDNDPTPWNRRPPEHYSDFGRS